MEREVVVVGAVRTPFGKYGGIIRNVPSVMLGAHVIKTSLDRIGVGGDLIDEIYYGTCWPAEYAQEGNIPGRQALLLAGLPESTISITVDRACCSSMAAVHLGYRSIKSGLANLVLAVGSENIARTAYLMGAEMRWSHGVGNVALQDPLFKLGYKFWNPVAVDGGNGAVRNGVSREEQDAWAVRSHQRYFEAKAGGFFENEIVPLPVKQPKGEEVLFSEDELPRPDASLEKLRKLPTVYGSPTVTAGNAPGLDAGASCVALASRDKARELGLEVLGTIESIASVAMAPDMISESPASAIEKAVQAAGRKIEDMDRIEINEAFAAMPLVSSKLLAAAHGLDLEELRGKINVNGGAIAIGHPMGASGARILLTSIYELRRRGGGCGVAAICGGLGQGDSAVIRVG